MPTAIPVRPVQEPPPATVPQAPTDTLLPHWGPVRRAVHRVCRRSRAANTLVAAVEMRLGRDELLSLPQYMALCPTGQCNALCAFCSVTTNRTGILKKQLPFEAISRFTAPVSRVIRMYGLEGNGEPTLYERFDELADALLGHGSTAYLITNGDRLTPETIERLVRGGLDAVNFSVNAATAETHRRVMKLRDFERVLANIRRFVQMRGAARRPTVSISMVVTRDNIQEVVDFMRLGEEDLQVDRVLVRPLSEIATDLGAVEDVRPLVPFESEIADMLEAVGDYLRFTPRRATIEMAPETFRAVRPDAGGAPAVPGDAQTLPAPRPAYWTTVDRNATVEWTWNAVTIRRHEPHRGRILESVPIAIPRGEIRYFRCDVTLGRGRLTIAAGPPGGDPLATADAHTSGPIELCIPAGEHESLALWLEAAGPADARVLFDRMSVPARPRRTDFLLPYPGRWEITSPHMQVRWTGTKVALQGMATSGPYLLKSYSAACARHVRLNVPLAVQVQSGVLGIGVLSGDQQRWLTTRTIDAADEHHTALTFETGENDRVHVVVYSARDGHLDACIDWGPILEPAPARLEGRHVAGKDLAQVPAAAVRDAPSPQARVGVRQRWQAAVQRAVRGPVRYYCQKPWTDLHNFSVDGRMDVCCIATGESQTRYALGNLLTQPFQEVWNGPQAREFRRTVNSGSPLPPCRRCPMAFAYQGPLFNPAGAERRIRAALNALCAPLPLGRTLYALGCRVLIPLVSHTVFRGFKR